MVNYFSCFLVFEDKWIFLGEAALNQATLHGKMSARGLYRRSLFLKNEILVIYLILQIIYDMHDLKCYRLTGFF
jgi:hypothetical protein